MTAKPDKKILFLRFASFYSEKNAHPENTMAPIDITQAAPGRGLATAPRNSLRVMSEPPPVRPAGRSRGS